MATPVVSSVSGASYSFSSGPGSGNLSVPIPSGTQAGDLLIAKCLATDPSGAGISPPSPPAGWTTLNSQTLTLAGFSLIWKIATAQDVIDAAFAFTGFPTSSTGSTGRVDIARITGFDTTIAVPITFNTSNSGTGTAATTTGFTTTKNSLLLQFVSAYKDGSASAITVSGYAIATNNPTWTESYDVNTPSGNSATFHSENAMASAPQTVAGATGTGSATIANSANHWSMSMLSIAPSPFLPASIVMTATIPNPVLRFVVQTAMSFVSHVNDAIFSAVSPKWHNADKHDASWNNANKN